MTRRCMLLLFALTVALVATGVAPAWAQTASVVSSQDYKGFWYTEVTPDRGKPYIRRLPASPFMYLPVTRGLHDMLADPVAWYACSLDGDASLRGDV